MNGSRPSPVRIAAGLLGLLLVLPACSGALFSRTRASAGQPRAGTLDGTGRLPADKAEALAAWGPPAQVVPQFEGDVFVYRLQRVDQEVINLNTGFIAPVAVPVWARLTGLWTELRLYARFDREGRLVEIASTVPLGGLADGKASPDAPSRPQGPGA